MGEVTFEFVTPDDTNDMAEVVCRATFDHGLDVFRERWVTGEYSWSHDLPVDLHCKIVRVAMLLRDL